MQIFVYIIFLIVILWLIAMWPGRGRPERMREFEKYYIAHRGLHDNSGPAPENSLAAFRLAVENGYGVEFDVHETRDETLAVVHDSNLKRVAGCDRDIEDMSLMEAEKLRLFSSEETVPFLGDVLETIGGKVPIVLEIKIRDRKNIARICEEVSFFLDAYEGQVCIESFDPGVLRWYKKHRPQMLRGQLAERFSGFKFPVMCFMFFISCCGLNFLTKPDFIAYNHHHAGLLRFRILRDLFHAECAAWTVRSEEELARAKRNFDIFIFEGFRPEERAEARPESPKEAADRQKAMQNIIRKHLYVSGRVQAVGFRFRATNIAQNLGVTGWVRNLVDERVEMEIQGTPAKLDRMMKDLNEQRWIEITDVEEKEIPVDPHESEFKVKY